MTVGVRYLAWANRDGIGGYSLQRPRTPKPVRLSNVVMLARAVIYHATGRRATSEQADALRRQLREPLDLSTPAEVVAIDIEAADIAAWSAPRQPGLPGFAAVTA